MALTNYMTGAEATSVTSMGGDVLHLGVDGLYSMAMWAISFVTSNFAIILVTIAIGFIINAGMKKLHSRHKGGTVV